MMIINMIHETYNFRFVVRSHIIIMMRSVILFRMAYVIN